MVNVILAKRVNHIVAKGDNPIWPKGSKSRGFSSYAQAGKFLGTFDGAGCTIYNLQYNSSEGHGGLFKSIGTSGVVKNLNIASCNITISTGNYGAGGIAYLNFGRIENCHVTGSITGTIQVGGIVGNNDALGSIIACSNAAEVNGESRRTGGICGFTYGTIVACSNTGTIKGINEVGGIAGTASNAQLLACWNSGTTEGTASVGAIKGSSSGSVTSCYFSNGTDNGYGTQVSDWASAVSEMNVALQEAGYNYMYEMGTGDLPVIKATNQSQ